MVGDKVVPSINFKDPEVGVALKELHNQTFYYYLNFYNIRLTVKVRLDYKLPKFRDIRVEFLDNPSNTQNYKQLDGDELDQT